MESNFVSTMLLIMLSVNVFLGMVDHSMSSMNEDVSYFNVNNTPAGSMTTGELNGSFTADYDNDAKVDTADSIGVNNENSFTDSFKSIKAWWDKMNSKFGLAFSILRQPAGFMKDIGFPPIIYNSFGVMWYGIGLIALIYLLTGRN